MFKFKDIKEFTQDGHYHVDVNINYFKQHIDNYVNEYGLELNPDFQRGHVWNQKQQIAFVEYILRGGITSSIRFNHPNWMTNFKGEMVCVDGLQRCTAISAFVEDEIEVFGHKYSEYEGISRATISIRVNNLKTRAEVLQWYLDLNSGGTIHTNDEINKVKLLLEKENPHN